MNERVVEAINRQINSELSASYSYLAMSTWCERQKVVGASRWLRLQSQEEYLHAMKLLEAPVAFEDLPACLPCILDPGSGILCQVIDYSEEGAFALCRSS